MTGYLFLVIGLSWAFKHVVSFKYLNSHIHFSGPLSFRHEIHCFKVKSFALLWFSFKTFGLLFLPPLNKPVQIPVAMKLLRVLLLISSSLTLRAQTPDEMPGSPLCWLREDCSSCRVRFWVRNQWRGSMNFMLFQIKHHGCCSQWRWSEAAIDLPIKINGEMYWILDAPELWQKKMIWKWKTSDVFIWEFNVHTHMVRKVETEK